MATREPYTRGISDITSSEGRLWRFTRIAHFFRQHRIIERAAVRKLISEKSELKNTTVIDRHLSIMDKLGIIQRRESDFAATGEGDSLCELAGNNKAATHRLAAAEQIFYFRALFSNAFFQLYTLLESRHQAPDVEKNEAVADYFTRIAESPCRLWRRETLHRGLERFRSEAVVSRGLENKFECMRMWLEQLDLVKGLRISAVGAEFLNDIKCHGEDLSDRMYSIANVYVTGYPNFLPAFDYSNPNHRRSFQKLFNQAYQLFERRELTMSDARAMRTFVCTKILLEHKLTMEEWQFNRMVDQLLTEGIVTSAMTADDGKLAYLHVQSPGGHLP